MLYALSLRHNSGPGVLVLILFGAWIYPKLFRGIASWRATFALGMLVFGLLFAIVSFVNWRLSAGRQISIIQATLLHDLTGISLAEGEIFLPKSARRDGYIPSLDELRAIYHTGDLVSLFGGNPAINLELATSTGDLVTLRKTWFATVFQHPRAYFQHRINVFKPFLGIGSVCYAYETGISVNPFGIQIRPTEANRTAMKLLSIFQMTPIFRPWYYLAAIGLMCLAFLRVRSVVRIPALVLATSAVLYELPYFFIAPGCDFRLSWFVVLTALLMGVLLARALVLERQDPHQIPRLNPSAGS